MLAWQVADALRPPLVPTARGTECVSEVVHQVLVLLRCTQPLFWLCWFVCMCVCWCAPVSVSVSLATQAVLASVAPHTNNLPGRAVAQCCKGTQRVGCASTRLRHFKGW
jgi:hypothetical protein